MSFLRLHSSTAFWSLVLTLGLSSLENGRGSLYAKNVVWKFLTLFIKKTVASPFMCSFTFIRCPVPIFICLGLFQDSFLIY